MRKVLESSHPTRLTGWLPDSKFRYNKGTTFQTSNSHPRPILLLLAVHLVLISAPLKPNSARRYYRSPRFFQPWCPAVLPNRRCLIQHQPNADLDQVSHGVIIRGPQQRRLPEPTFQSLALWLDRGPTRKIWKRRDRGVGSDPVATPNSLFMLVLALTRFSEIVCGITTSLAAPSHSPCRGKLW